MLSLVFAVRTFQKDITEISEISEIHIYKLISIKSNNILLNYSSTNDDVNISVLKTSLETPIDKKDIKPLTAKTKNEIFNKYRKSIELTSIKSVTK